MCKKRVMMHSFERELEIDTITCNDDLKSIGSCYVVDVQPPKSNGGKVNNLVQMYEKCSQEDEKRIGDYEIEGLKNANQELMFEVEVLKVEKYALEKKVEDISKKNHKLKKINKSLTIENESTVQELEDLAKLT